MNMVFYQKFLNEPIKNFQYKTFSKQATRPMPYHGQELIKTDTLKNTLEV